MKTWNLRLALALFVFLPCFPALAGNPDEEARAQFQNGIEFFKAGAFEQAAVAFARAYEIKPSYKILYNVGQVESELKHYARALDAYVRYLAEGGAEGGKERVAEVKAEINRLNTLVGSIHIVCDEPGLAVMVDGERRGETPLAVPVFVDMGQHEVALRRGLDVVYSEKVRVVGGGRAEIDISKKAKPGSAAPVVAEPHPEPAKAAVEPKKESGESTPTKNEPQRVWTWVAFGVGGAGAVAASITGGLALSKAKDVDSKCNGNVCPTSAKDEADTADTLGWTTNALIGVAVLGVAAGVVLWFYEPDLASAKEVTVTPTAGTDAGGLVVSGRF
jgi:hypothetical protein